MSEEEFSDSSRKILAILALIYGLFHLTLAPLIFNGTLQNLMEKIVSLIPTQPALETAPFFQTLWFSAWLVLP